MHSLNKVKVLALALLCSSALLGVQVITLENNNDYVFKESGDHVLENAMYLYHHYYQRTCDLKLIDFTLAPVYRYYRVIPNSENKNTTSIIDSQVTNNLYGGFAQAVLNLGDLWIRTDTLFGKMTERFHTKNTYPDGTKGLSERSFAGFDDITVRAGYDFFVNGDDHWGPYILGSIPVNHEVNGFFTGTAATNWSTLLKAPEQPTDPKAQRVTKTVPLTDLFSPEKDLSLDIKTPQMGAGNYRIGGGLQGACTVYDCNENHIALFGDIQYSYAMATSLGIATFKEMSFVDAENKNITRDISQAVKSSNKTVLIKDPEERTEIKFSAGSLFNILGVMHYARGDFNLELGCLFSAGFGQKLQQTRRVTTSGDSAYPEAKKQTKTEDKNEDVVIKDGIAEISIDEVTFKLNNVPNIVKFRAQPYLALGFNTLISDNPFTIGAGIGYDYKNTSKQQKPNSFHGINAWATALLSF